MTTGGIAKAQVLDSCLQTAKDIVRLLSFSAR